MSTALLPVIQPDAAAYCTPLTSETMDAERADTLAKTLKALGRRVMSNRQTYR